ncbi:hypothetical protein ACN47E_000509 [Coniothyrium glycines]
MKSNAPKPNTNFLRHIIRQTDSHNAALLAREAEESSARLKSINRERERERRRNEETKQKKADGRLTPVRSDDEADRRPRREHGDVQDDRDRKRRRRVYEDDQDTRPTRHGPSDRDSQTRRREVEPSHRDRSRHKSRSSKSHRDHRRRRDDSSGDDHQSQSHSRETRSSGIERRRRSYSKSESRSRSPRRDKHDERRKPRDRSPVTRSAKVKRHESSRRSRSSSSDPLESIVGPLFPSAEPPVRARGRGAQKANSTGIESRFSSTYDSSIDMDAASNMEDDWGDALEAFRDRQRWKQQGADRLTAAGFTDVQVKKWERGDEPNEEDVVWARQGQKREWDRGKIIDEDGEVGVKAEFGRLT